jgi:hypothetical protein
MTCQSVRGDRVAVIRARRVALPEHPSTALPQSCFDVSCPPRSSLMCRERCDASRRSSAARSWSRFRRTSSSSIRSHSRRSTTPGSGPRQLVLRLRLRELLSARRPHRLKSHVQEFENLSFEDLTHWEVKLHVHAT